MLYIINVIRFSCYNFDQFCKVIEINGTAADTGVIVRQVRYSSEINMPQRKYGFFFFFRFN